VFVNRIEYGILWTRYVNFIFIFLFRNFYKTFSSFADKTTTYLTYKTFGTYTLRFHSKIYFMNTFLTTIYHTTNNVVGKRYINRVLALNRFKEKTNTCKSFFSVIYTIIFILSNYISTRSSHFS